MVASLTARLAAAERALAARDQTIEALVNREKDRAAKRHSAYDVLDESAALQQVVARKTVELEEQNRKLEQTSAALRETSSLLEVLLDHSPDYIYFKDRESRFLRGGRQQAIAFGLDHPAELVGKSDQDFFDPAHAGPALRDEQQIIRTGEPLIGKVEKEVWPDGRETWVLTSKMPLRNPSGEIIGTFGISKDITAIKQAEARLEIAHQQLLETSRLAGMAEVATGVLHNVGNVLNSVNVGALCVADYLRKSKLPGLAKVVALLRAHEPDLGSFFSSDPHAQRLPNYLEQLAAHLATEQTTAIAELVNVQKNIEHIKEIVAMQQDIATVSGVLESVPATLLVEDSLRMNISSLDRHDIRVTREFQPAPPVQVDKHKALQILVNLIRNAKQACREANCAESLLTLRISPGPGCVRISVGDNGVGIPSENLTRIFNHGFTTKKGGHGFGLHSGALAAKEMGGVLQVHSDGVGTGATFTLELPIESPSNSHEKN